MCQERLLAACWGNEKILQAKFSCQTTRSCILFVGGLLSELAPFLMRGDFV